jgi:hypothetical protein
MVERRLSPSDHPARRTSDRYPLDADVEVVEPVRAHGVVINASEGGMCIAVDSDLPLGVECVIEIALEEGKTIETARVAWLRQLPDGYLAGVTFVR